MPGIASQRKDRSFFSGKLVMACSASSEMRPFRNNAPQLIAELNISDITAVLPSHKTATRQG